MESPFSPEWTTEFASRAKVAIRKRMKALRSSHPASALAARSRALVERLLEEPELDRLRGVALFWPMIERGEVDLRDFDGQLRERGVAVYYPFMDPTPSGFRTGFRLSRDASELQDRGQKFFEPPLDAPEAVRGEVDWVLVPALAVDERGHRIGYGAGYYDATLADLCPPARRIIVAYDFQRLAEIPAEAHDVACDRIVTDRRSWDAVRSSSPTSSV